MSILAQILEHKRVEIAEASASVSAEEMHERARARTEPPRDFRAALQDTPAPRVIAELKRRSPSRGELRADFDPAALAKHYAEAGAAALSVLTDARWFGGSLAALRAARAACALPILRKEFILDAYQVDEARAEGADAVLLLAAALDDAQLKTLHARAHSHGLAALVEVHDEAELARAVALGATLIGVNNRDLRSFVTDLGVTERLAKLRPPGALLVAESGVVQQADIARLQAAGADAFLVGETLMRAPDVGRALRELRGAP